MCIKHHLICLLWRILPHNQHVQHTEREVCMWSSVLETRTLGPEHEYAQPLPCDDGLEFILSITPFCGLRIGLFPSFFLCERDSRGSNRLRAIGNPKMASKHFAIDFPGTITPSSVLWLGVYGLVLAFVLNVLRQLLPRSKSEPPVIFHWIPFIGSAISYGTDPCKFYKQCREKVCCVLPQIAVNADHCAI